MTKRKINLIPGPHQHFARRHRVGIDVAGVGQRNAPIPNDLEQQVLESIEGPKGFVDDKGNDEPSAHRTAHRWLKTDRFDPMAVTTSGAALTPANTSAVVAGSAYDAEFQALIRTTDVVQHSIIARQFDDALEAAFGGMMGNADWAIANMSPRFKRAFRDHRRQIARLEGNTRSLLPTVRDKLIAKNPGVPGELIIQHAIKLTFEKLPQLLYVLRRFDTVIGQYKNGDQARLLNSLNTYMTATFHLFQGGDLGKLCSGETCTPKVAATGNYRVGDLILTGMFGRGLYTIPRGPIGLHLLNMPRDMLGYAIAPGGPLLGHESWHNIENDRRGMLEERLTTIAQSVKAAYQAGLFKLKNKTMPMGDDTIETIDFVIKVLTDWLEETAADASGLICFNGPRSATRSIDPSFWAINTPVGRVVDNPSPYQRDSVYSLVPLENGTLNLELEPHPEEAWRLGSLQPTVYEEIGFHDDADEQRSLIRMAMGGQLNETIKWKVEEGDSDVTFELLRSDLDAVAAFYVRQLIRRPLKSLGGKSCADIVMWDNNRERKKRLLVDNLLSGNANVPTGQGDILPTLWIPAATDACFARAQNGELTTEKLVEIQQLAMEGIEKTSSAPPSKTSSVTTKPRRRTTKGAA